MRRAASNSPARPRTRRKPAATLPEVPTSAPRNVGSIEALLSLTLGVLMVVAALVPRSFKQLFLLGFGGGLVYRGLTGNCGLYQAAGIDTAKGALLPQVGAKVKQAAKD